jgi:hypothetical protein
VFLEDPVSISGDVIAFAAFVLNQIIGSSIPHGVAAVLIALMMIRQSPAHPTQPRLSGRRLGMAAR